MGHKDNNKKDNLDLINKIDIKIIIINKDLDKTIRKKIKITIINNSNFKMFLIKTSKHKVNVVEEVAVDKDMLINIRVIIKWQCSHSSKIKFLKT